MVVADDDDNNDKKADGPGMGCIATAACNGKRQARLPTYHFERLIDEDCPNHTYPIKNMLDDYDMMKNFMTSRSLTWGREHEEDSGGSDAMPFPRKDVVMMVYSGRPLLGGAACLT
jgi:hypothetical protein